MSRHVLLSSFAVTLMQHHNKEDKLAWSMLLFLSLVWGCSFILIKKSLVAFDPVQLACLRIGISALALSPIVWYHRNAIQWYRWKKFVAVGLTGSGIPAFLFFFAQTRINSSMAGLLNSLTPIWTLLISIFIFKTPFTRHKLAGVLLGFAGAAILISMGKQNGLNTNPLYGIFVVIATVCYASSVNMVQAFFSGTRPIIISAMSFFLIGLPAWVYLLFSDLGEVMDTQPLAWQALASVTALSLLGTVMASIVFYNLVQRTNAVFASTVTYLMPVVALIWGVIDGEAVTPVTLMGLGTILAGVYITKRSR